MHAGVAKRSPRRMLCSSPPAAAHSCRLALAPQQQKEPESGAPAVRCCTASAPTRISRRSLKDSRLHICTRPDRQALAKHVPAAHADATGLWHRTPARNAPASAHQNPTRPSSSITANLLWGRLVTMDTRGSTCPSKESKVNSSSAGWESGMSSVRVRVSATSGLPFPAAAFARLACASPVGFLEVTAAEADGAGLPPYAPMPAHDPQRHCTRQSTIFQPARTAQVHPICH
mmetsp:Transcript_29157/g.73320  ORF Transcript_29157/g.73320 Transcript_29157/m.73320 type:complete len:231 (+) Transcript_29157:1299-1991(+)